MVGGNSFVDSDRVRDVKNLSFLLAEGVYRWTGRDRELWGVARRDFTK